MVRQFVQSKNSTGNSHKRYSNQNRNGRNQTEIEADWEIQGGAINKRVKIRNIRLSIVQDSQTEQVDADHDNNTINQVNEIENSLPEPEENLISSQETVIVHGYEWTKEKVMHDIGRTVPEMFWTMRTSNGKVFSEHSHSVYSTENSPLLDYFMACFPISELTRIASLTSINLSQKNKQQVTV